MFARLFPRKYLTPEQWSDLVATVQPLARYPAPDRDRLMVLANAFLNEKEIEGAGGFEVDDHVRRIVAAQACVPILNLGLHWYRGWYAVVVYPGEFRVSREYVDDAGVVHETTSDLSGECWDRGPVILSWEDLEADAYDPDPLGSVAIHEFAHKLDLLNGDTNGMPPLHPDMDTRAWSRQFRAAFGRFRASLARDEDVPFDPYAATSPGEFFAVASEAFFMCPGPVRALYPDVYRQLAAFYRQNPHPSGAAEAGGRARPSGV